MLLNDMHEDWNESDNDVRPAIATLHTDGGGYWNVKAAPVRITELSLGYISPEDDEDFGELCVHFNTDDWRPDRDGLIYTDRLFAQELNAFLQSQGMDPSDLGYSEQGMQGDNYVSLDCGPLFLASYKAKYPEQYEAALLDAGVFPDDIEPLFPNL